MSTAFYPQNMRTMPSGGRYNATLPGQYITWKGTGVLSNPVGTAPSHIRPLTNRDPGNAFLSGSFPSRTYNRTRVFIPRPLKQYRKGRVIPSAPISTDETNTSEKNREIELINYNMNRIVISSKGTSLGGGFGGSGLLNEMQDKPGSYIVKVNQPGEKDNISELNRHCKTCEGVGIIASYYPNNTYLTDNPEPTTESKRLCCNEEYKALRRVIYASTNLKKNYYTTTKQYLQNRCKTFEQKSFNFQQIDPIKTSLQLQSEKIATTRELLLAKPGSPLTTFNTYLANCFPNGEIYEATEIALITRFLNYLLKDGLLTQTQIDEFTSIDKFNFAALFVYLKTLPSDQSVAATIKLVAFIDNPYYGVPFAGPSNPYGCKLTVYKPNNPQYAIQGAVSSSTRVLKLNVDTISTNAASLHRNNNIGLGLVTANELYRGNHIVDPSIYKNKSQKRCNAPPNIYPFQNKKVCYYSKQLPQYQVPASQPSPYRYYIGTVFNTNHYSQSPNTYNTPSRSIRIKR